MPVYTNTYLNSLTAKWDDFEDFIDNINNGNQDGKRNSVKVFHQLPSHLGRAQAVFKVCLKLWSGQDIDATTSGGTTTYTLTSDPVHKAAAFLTSGSELNKLMKNGMSFVDLIDSLFLTWTNLRKERGIGSWFFQCYGLTMDFIANNSVADSDLRKARDWIAGTGDTQGGWADMATWDGKDPIRA